MLKYTIHIHNGKYNDQHQYLDVVHYEIVKAFVTVMDACFYFIHLPAFSECNNEEATEFVCLTQI